MMNEEKVVNEKPRKLFVTVTEFHEMIGGVITRVQIYRMINNGEIPVRKIGNKVLLSAEWVNNFLNTPFECVGKTSKPA